MFLFYSEGVGRFDTVVRGWGLNLGVQDAVLGRLEPDLEPFSPHR